MTLDSELKLINDLFIVNDEKTTTTAADIDSKERIAAIESKRKRKLETIEDIDFELERILTKFIRQAEEQINVPSANTSLFIEAVAILPKKEQMLMTSEDATNAKWIIDTFLNSVEPITSTQSGIKESDENEEFLLDDSMENISETEASVDLSISYIRNTDPERHCKNPSYQCERCELCGKNDPCMPNHYMRKHRKHEVLVARPSPQMAARLRLQSDEFKMFDRNNISGFCYFCEDTQTMPRSSWVLHILTHTGEVLYVCDSADRSIVGFLCKECNFLQLEGKRVIDHLKKEHGFECPTEKCHYEKLTLVPSVKPNTVRSAATDSTNVSTKEIKRSKLSRQKSITFLLPNEKK
ncbi:uncharacterized protein LOC129570452 [Sitodiplosis mosellana]|uniref:uncharacterized protein LOC129570452 n=1 Tax=Sitodiplosis mosellana TaxID=263140 RepID=UPI002444B25B|nr:uncharacterized protein LOC129570452 [Sitodiplosis mosellana]